MGLSATQGVGSCGLWSSMPPAMEVGEVSPSDLFSWALSAHICFSGQRSRQTWGGPTSFLGLTFCSATWNGLHSNSYSPSLLFNSHLNYHLQETFPDLRSCLVPSPPCAATVPGTSSAALGLHSIASRAHKLAACRLNLACRNICLGPLYIDI